MRGFDASRHAAVPEGSRFSATADDHLDALQDLGDEIATLAAHIHAAEHRFRTGIDLGAALERVRASRALENLPRISASMAQGELSFTKVRALTRVATPESEDELLELAHSCTAAQLERVVRAWRSLSRHDEAELERMRHRSRYFSVFPDEEGMYLVRGRLDPEVGAMLLRAVAAAGDTLYRASASLGPSSGPGASASSGPSADLATDIEPKQRRADVVGLLAERVLAVGFGGEEVGGSRAERYQVVLHVESDTLQADTEPGRSDLEDGTRVSAETSRRLSCASPNRPTARSSMWAARPARSLPRFVGRSSLATADAGSRAADSASPTPIT